MNSVTPSIEQALGLAHELGAPALRMAILGEGNISVRLSEEAFAVKASGGNLATLAAAGMTACRFEGLLPLLDSAGMVDLAVDQELLDARVDPAALKPSVEALFHAWLLTLPGINFVGHVHAIAVNQVLCSPRAREFARHRMLPDEVVCCSTESVFVPYTDPGLALAQAIRRETSEFIERTGREPRVILLANHGIVAIGPTRQAVSAAIAMAEKCAQIFVGAAAMGGPHFLDSAQVQRIAGRPDEHYRRRALGI